MKKHSPDPVLEALREACGDEDKAVALFEVMRWPDGKAVCPKCGTVGESYAMTDRATGKRERNYRWRCRACKERYTVRTGSVLEETRLPLHKWAHAYWAACSSKKGVSALQISRECAVSYKTALFLMHRIRYAMAENPNERPKLSGQLEADETYVGGKPRKHDGPPVEPSRREAKGVRRRYLKSKKVPVVALVQRGGDVRFSVMERVTAKKLGAFLAENADLSNSTLNTDEAPIYGKPGKRFKGGHRTVNHSAYEYARADGSHSNTAESVFSRLKRGLYGIWHSVSKHHLHRYLDNVAFLHNTRELDDSARFGAAVRGGVGRRLQYRSDPRSA
jgi:transposase-like protein